MLEKYLVLKLDVVEYPACVGHKVKKSQVERC